MKIFKHRNLMGCIFAIVMAVPLLSILCRSSYVVFNKNAYQSFSGKNESEYVEITNIELGKSYNFNINNVPYESYDSGKIIYTNPTNIETSNITLKQAIIDNTYIRIYATTTNKLIELGIENTANTSMSVVSIPLDFEFELVSYQSNKESEFKLVNRIVENTNNYYLDNAFDYSLSKFVDDNSFGNLNFFQWFESLFLDMSNSSNALYIHFVNWYMNYALFVSCAYILFLVLMWFINFSRRLLERGMNYDW